jgi:hypothetical protein
MRYFMEVKNYIQSLCIKFLFAESYISVYSSKWYILVLT